jgi:hypothetical protein
MIRLKTQHVNRPIEYEKGKTSRQESGYFLLSNDSLFNLIKVFSWTQIYYIKFYQNIL